MLDLMKSLLSRRREAQDAARRRMQFVLAIETLEDRTVPTLFLQLYEPGFAPVLVAGSGGEVDFNGSVGTFNNVSVGFSQPILGSPTQVSIDLNSAITTQTGGTLTVTLADTDFALNPMPSTLLLNSIATGDIVGAPTDTLTVQSWANPNNLSPLPTSTNPPPAPPGSYSAFPGTGFTVNPSSSSNPTSFGTLAGSVTFPAGNGPFAMFEQITSTFAGSGYVDPDFSSSVTSSPVQFSTAAGPIVVLGSGTPLTDSATLTGLAGANPGGTVTFNLYQPSDTSYSNPIDTEAVNIAGSVVNGSVTVSTPNGFVPMASTGTGIYEWVASYSGDANNPSVNSGQGNEPETVIPPPPSISNVVINQDIPALYDAAGQPAPGVQRSMVEDIVYTFSEPVNILSNSVDPNVFTIAVAAGSTGTVPTTIEWAAVAGSGNTQWEVDFGVNPNATGSQAGALASIANGAYTITVSDPASITAQSDDQALNLAASGIGGSAQSFYRLFGDINGDRMVNAADNEQLKLALTAYNPAFDYNQDGFVNALDNLEFKLGMAVNLSGFTPTI